LLTEAGALSLKTGGESTPVTRFIACTCAYDGSKWCGSQKQANGPSVQGEVERALESVLKHRAPIILAGRTDAGVHATGQCFRFETDNKIPVERVPRALNSTLDKSVRVLRAWEVDENFHPRFSARSRTYRYRIECAEVRNVLLRGIAAHERSTLNIGAMQDAARVLIGTHDFAAWQSSGSPTKTTVRTVKRLEICERENVFDSRIIEVEIEADAFLYQMVRNIVGALIKAGQGVLLPVDIERLTLGEDRRKCPPPAPPQGLCLVDVKY
jgi:tRNA pseudouridine38-40 synthase